MDHILIDIILVIITKLDIKSFLFFTCTCKRYLELSQTEYNWKVLIDRDFSYRYPIPLWHSWLNTYKQLKQQSIVTVIYTGVVGYERSGKKTWLNRVTTGNYSKRYIKFTESHVFTSKVNTNKGKVLVISVYYPNESIILGLPTIIRFTNGTITNEKEITVKSHLDRTRIPSSTQMCNINSRYNWEVLEPIKRAIELVIGKIDILPNDAISPPTTI